VFACDVEGKAWGVLVVVEWFTKGDEDKAEVVYFGGIEAKD